MPYCIAPYPSHPGRAVDAIVENPSSDAVAATAVAVAQAKVLTTEIAILATNKLHELGGTRSTLAQYNLDRHRRNAHSHPARSGALEIFSYRKLRAERDTAAESCLELTSFYSDCKSDVRFVEAAERKQSDVRLRQLLQCALKWQLSIMKLRGNQLSRIPQVT